MRGEAGAQVIRTRSIMHQGRYEEAEELLKEALQLRKQIYGIDDPRTLAIVKSVITNYEAWGKT